MALKQTGMQLLRSVGLMSSADELRYLIDRRQKRTANAHYAAEHPEAILPPDRLLYEIFGTVDYYHFIRSGLRSATSLSSLINEHISDVKNILEWGCGVGRIIRHFPAILGDEINLTGIDIDEKMIEWCRDNLRGIEFYRNNIEPPVDIPDNRYDAAYSASVFTHLSEELQKRWLSEILRLLRPEGIFVFTVHGDYYAEKKLTPSELNKYRRGDIIVRGNVSEGSRVMTAFHSEKYMRDVFLKDITIIDHIFDPELEIAGAQDIWIIKKTEEK